jgi:Bacterial cell division membrane protein
MNLGAKLYTKLKGDHAIWMIVIILAVFSVLIVYSSTGHISFKERGGNTEFYLIKHLVFILGGLVLTTICYQMHYTRFLRISPLLLLISIPLLVYTIAFGTEVNEARRWIELPFIDMTFQTSDFAKLALIIYVARAISSKQEYIKDFKSGFLPIVMPIIIICGLIAPADLSTAMLLFTTCLLMMVMGRVAIRDISWLVLMGVATFGFLIALGSLYPELVRVGTWITRMNEFFDGSDGGYQIQQAKIAIADGGLFGLGPGNSVQRNFLPAPYSDFIFAIIIEEYGLIGAFTVIAMYVLLFFRIVRIITNSPKAFGAMLVLGLGLIICIQALVNIAVSVDLVPITGLTLPMISMGGTSIIFSSIAFGMILSVSRYIEKI